MVAQVVSAGETGAGGAGGDVGVGVGVGVEVEVGVGVGVSDAKGVLLVEGATDALCAGWAVRISPAGELPPRIGSALWIALPLVESAVYAHRRAEAGRASVQIAVVTVGSVASAPISCAPGNCPRPLRFTATTC